MSRIRQLINLDQMCDWYLSGKKELGPKIATEAANLLDMEACSTVESIQIEVQERLGLWSPKEAG